METLEHHYRLTHHGVQTETQSRHDLNVPAKRTKVLCCKVPGIILCCLRIRSSVASPTMRSLTCDHLGPYVDSQGVWTHWQSSCFQEYRRTDALDASGPDDAWNYRILQTAHKTPLGDLHLPQHSRPVHSYLRQDWRQRLPSWFHQQQRPQPAKQNPWHQQCIGQHCWYGVELEDFPSWTKCPSGSPIAFPTFWERTWKSATEQIPVQSKP